MSKARASKRKKVVKAQNSKKDFKPSFTGGMKLPLNAETDQEIESRTKFDGQWLTKRFKIMNKPRRYKIEIVLVDDKGDQDRTEIRVTDRIDKNELWQIIMLMGKENLQKYKDKFIDANASFATVKA